MKYEDFVKAVETELRAEIEKIDENNKVMFKVVEKMNENYDGFAFEITGRSATPTLNVRKMYDSMIEDGLGIAEVVEEAIALLMMDPEEQGIKEDFIEEGYDPKKVFTRVYREKGNEEMMAKCPYLKVEDIIITFHYAVNMDDRGIASTIFNDMLVEAFEVSRERVIADGLKNGKDLFPAVINTMRDMVISNMVKEGVPEDLAEELVPHENGRQMYVVTNQLNINGAATLFYDGVMEEVSKKIGGDFYALPSSVHEFIAIPVDDEIPENEINSMIISGNAQVEERDILGEHAYIYRAADKSFKAI